MVKSGGDSAMRKRGKRGDGLGLVPGWRWVFIVRALVLEEKGERGKRGEQSTGDSNSLSRGNSGFTSIYSRERV